MNHLSQDRNLCATKKRNHSQTFYKLTEDELLKVSSLLKDGEMAVYFYLCVKVPFDDSVFEFKVDAIAKVLGKSTRTIQRALKRIIELDLFQVEIQSAKIRRQNCRGDDKIVALNDKSVATDDKIVAEMSDVSQPMTKMSQSTAESITVQSFQKPSDSLQTNTDFKTHTDHPPARDVCVNVDFDEETRAYFKAVANYQESEYSPTPVEQHQLEQDSIVEPTNPIEDKSSAEIDVLVYKPMIEKLGVRYEAVVKQLRENPENIQSALASLQEAKDMNQCKNPTGYLKKALIEGWQPEKQQYLAPLNASTKSPAQMSDEEWMIYLANTLTRERRNQLIRFVIPGELGERIAVLANGIKMSFAQAKNMTIQQFEQMAMA